MKSVIATEAVTIKVEYAGYLSAFIGVGSHPQFRHLTSPPLGYEFVQRGSTAMAELRIVRWTIKLGRLLRLMGPLVRLVLSAIRNGARPDYVVSFIKTRGLRSQLQMPASVRLAFLPSFPFTLGQVPWVIEIEDTTTLFRPFIFNGQTSSIEISETPYYPFVKALIESDSCKGIICHIESTAKSIPLLFDNAELCNKITHAPLGIELPPVLPAHKKQENDVTNILFTNSWHQGSYGFYLRGGLDLLEAFCILTSKYPNVRLILKTRLPSDLDRRYLNMITENWKVQVIEQFLSSDDMQKLISNADIYVLPAARVHIVSILEAMAYGIPVVVSDGWGFQEYVEDGWNGMVVRGRYGKCSWIDTANGMLREDYSSLWSPDPIVIGGLVDALSALIEDRELRERLGQNARRDVETKFSIDNWNRGLKKVFDKVLSKDNV